MRSGHYVSVDAAAPILGLGNAMTMVAGDDDRIALRIDAAHDADMTAATPRHDGDGADLGPRHAMAVMREGPRHIRARALMAGALEHEVHERAAPQAAPMGRIGAEPAACFRNDRRTEA